MKLSIIFPIFNNVDEFQSKYKSFKIINERYNFFSEIIVIDDSNQQNLKIENFCMAENIKLFKNTKNFGKGFSVQKGFQKATGDFFIFCDSDIPFTDSSLINFVFNIKSKKPEILIADRSNNKRSNKKQSTLLRYFLSLLFRKITSLLFTLDNIDTQCGLKAFRKDRAQTLFKNLTIKRYAFDIEVLYRAKYLNYKIETFPIVIQNNGKTSLKLLKDGFKMIIDLIIIKIFSLKHLDLKRGADASKL